MKKTFFISFIMLSMSLIINAQTADDIKTAKDLTFFGVDYTNCYFVHSQAFYDLDDVKAKIIAWNNLFKSEYEKYLAKNFSKRKITFSDEMIRRINEQIDPATRVSDDESLYNHLNPEQIPLIIDNYKFSSELTGIGFILIAECYSKPEEKGSYYVVFFDIPTKKVLTVDRMTGKARGFGLRNYWANSYYVVLKDVGSKIK